MLGSVVLMLVVLRVLVQVHGGGHRGQQTLQTMAMPVALDGALRRIRAGAAGGRGRGVRGLAGPGVRTEVAGRLLVRALMVD